MRATPIVPWLPAVMFAACLAVGALGGVLGQRALRGMADTQLAVAGDYVAHHFQSLFVSRLRAMASVAAIDAQVGDGAERERQRRAMIDSLVRLHPELVWIGYAERPGRIAVGHRGLLEGADVSRRDWWSAALNGPFLGNANAAQLPAAAVLELARTATPPAEELRLDEAARPAGESRPTDVTRLTEETRPVEPERLLDVAVPLRRPDGEPYGVLAAHIDARWAIGVRDEMARVAAPIADIDVLVLQRDGTTLSGRRVGLGPEPAPDADGIREGRLDELPRTFSVHPIDGDVVVARLGWQVAVGRDPGLHEAPTRRFLGWSIAGGAVVGVLGAFAVALATRGPRRLAT